MGIYPLLFRWRVILKVCLMDECNRSVYMFLLASSFCFYVHNVPEPYFSFYIGIIVAAFSVSLFFEYMIFDKIRRRINNVVHELDETSPAEVRKKENKSLEYSEFVLDNIIDAFGTDDMPYVIESVTQVVYEARSRISKKRMAATERYVNMAVYIVIIIGTLVAIDSCLFPEGG